MVRRLLKGFVCYEEPLRYIVSGSKGYSPTNISKVLNKLYSQCETMQLAACLYRLYVCSLGKSSASIIRRWRIPSHSRAALEIHILQTPPPAIVKDCLLPSTNPIVTTRQTPQSPVYWLLMPTVYIHKAQRQFTPKTTVANASAVSKTERRYHRDDDEISNSYLRGPVIAPWCPRR